MRMIALTFAFFVASFAPAQQVPHPQKHQQKTQPVFEDDRIRVSIPFGWSLEPAVVQGGGGKPTGQQIGALLRKGKYKLYLLSHEEQSSGIVGGRFSEVVQYVSPWVDMSESPWLPCPSRGTQVKISGTKLSRLDLYFDTAHATKKALADCGGPKVSGILWYGSYFVETCQREDVPADCGGFFMSYQDLSGKPPRDRTENAWVTYGERWMTYSITYDTESPDPLPKRYAPKLGEVLREAGEIVRSIVYK